MRKMRIHICKAAKYRFFYPKNMIVFMKNSFRLNIDYSQYICYNYFLYFYIADRTKHPLPKEAGVSP